MKGIVEQMRDSKHIVLDGKFTKEDFDNMVNKLKIIQEEDLQYRSNRMKELKENEKHMLKRSKELNKEIPLELAYHCYLSFNKTYVGSDFMNKYKEWF